MLEEKALSREAVERALSMPAARVLVAAAIRKPMSVKALAQQTDLPMASVYRHVAELVKDGILVVERSALTPDGKAYDLFRSRIEGAHLALEADHVEVGWKINEAVEDRIAKLWDKLAE